MISLIVFIFNLVLIAAYAYGALYYFPVSMYEDIKAGNFSPETLSLLTTCILMLIICCIIAYFLSKTKNYDSFFSTVKMFSLIAFPIYYILMLLTTVIFKDSKSLMILLFKNGDSFIENIGIIIIIKKSIRMFFVS